MYRVGLPTWCCFGTCVHRHGCILFSVHNQQLKGVAAFDEWACCRLPSWQFGAVLAHGMRTMLCSVTEPNTSSVHVRMLLVRKCKGVVAYYYWASCSAVVPHRLEA